VKVFKKSDEDVLDYDIVLADWLPTGDEVDSATVVYDANSDIVFQGKELFNDRVKVWVGGGTSGNTYPFKVLANTKGGRTKEVNFLIVVTEQ
jgi:hypothetical protein